MSRFYVNLPAPQFPSNAMLNFDPLNKAIGSYKDGQTENAMFSYKQQRDRLADQRNSMRDGWAAEDRRDEQQKRALSNVVGQAQSIYEMPEDQREAAYQSFRASIPDFDADITAAGFDPNNWQVTLPAIIARSRGYQDPLDRQYKQAQIGKLQREAKDAGAAYGKSGSIFQGADGKFYSVQFGSDGSRAILPLEIPGQSLPDSAPPQQQPMVDGGAGRFAAPGLAGEGQPQSMPLTPARGVMEVGDTLVDKSTGGVVRNVGQNIAEGKRQEIVGRETGEGQMSLPKLGRTLETYNVKTKAVDQYIDVALRQSNPWSTGFIGNLSSYIAGTPAHDLSKTLTTIRANLGFETLQEMRDNSPTGGALGQVSNIENELLQSTWGNLMQSQSEAQLRENLQRIREIKSQFKEMKRKAYQDDVARFGAANVPSPENGSLTPPEETQSQNKTFNWTPDGGLQEAR